MKVGITYNNQTIYYDYIPNTNSNYALEKGDGKYSIALFKHISGAKYKKIKEINCNVKIDNPLSPYLINTYDINFSKDDIVSKTAEEICKDLKNDREKIITIKKYVQNTLSYDNNLAKKIKNKTIDIYIPNPVKTLENKSGICYDYASLFAAMCRSQGIPCKVKKGYLNNIYHAWNEVYLNEKWYKIDTLNTWNSNHI